MNKHVIVSEAITEYCAICSTNEPEMAETIFNESQSLTNSHMVVGKIIGNLLAILVSSSKAKQVLEIGTFIGYSAAMMASGLSEGTIVTIEEDAFNFALASKNLAELIEAGRVELIKSEGLNWLKNYQERSFDIIFLDARKEAYTDDNSVELLYKNLSMTGVLIVDNSLARGGALNPTAKWHELTREFNQKMASDVRFRSVLLPIRDGLLLCQKVS